MVIFVEEGGFNLHVRENFRTSIYKREDSSLLWEGGFTKWQKRGKGKRQAWTE
jgi:hypothetical protein